MDVGTLDQCRDLQMVNTLSLVPLYKPEKSLISNKWISNLEIDFFESLRDFNLEKTVISNLTSNLIDLDGSDAKLECIVGNFNLTLKSAPSYKQCHGFRLMKQDDFFLS